MIAIPDGTNLCPLAALREWIAAAGLTSGPLFRSINKGGRVSAEGLSGRTVANLVKQYTLAGLKAEASVTPVIGALVCLCRGSLGASDSKR
jgi:hypothetical protein